MGIPTSHMSPQSIAIEAIPTYIQTKKVMSAIWRPCFKPHWQSLRSPDLVCEAVYINVKETNGEYCIFMGCSRHVEHLTRCFANWHQLCKLASVLCSTVYKQNVNLHQGATGSLRLVLPSTDKPLCHFSPKCSLSMACLWGWGMYRKISNIRRTFVGD